MTVWYHAAFGLGIRDLYVSEDEFSMPEFNMPIWEMANPKMFGWIYIGEL
jgi:hypothetical protein